MFRKGKRRRKTFRNGNSIQLNLSDGKIVFKGEMSKIKNINFLKDNAVPSKGTL